MWTKQQIEYHKKAAKLLIKIKGLTFKHIQKNKLIVTTNLQKEIIIL